MSEEMSEMFGAMREARRQQHADWKIKNKEILNASGLTFSVANRGETLCFREAGKPKVDFYPSTGRWRVVGSNSKAKGGGAQKFLDWYREQKRGKE